MGKISNFDYKPVHTSAAATKSWVAEIGKQKGCEGCHIKIRYKKGVPYVRGRDIPKDARKYLVSGGWTRFKPFDVDSFDNSYCNEGNPPNKTGLIFEDDAYAVTLYGVDSVGEPKIKKCVGGRKALLLQMPGIPNAGL